VFKFYRYTFFHFLAIVRIIAKIISIFVP
jgi:hypothetical protein